MTRVRKRLREESRLCSQHHRNWKCITASEEDRNTEQRLPMPTLRGWIEPKESRSSRSVYLSLSFGYASRSKWEREHQREKSVPLYLVFSLLRYNSWLRLVSTLYVQNGWIKRQNSLRENIIASRRGVIALCPVLHQLHRAERRETGRDR